MTLHAAVAPQASARTRSRVQPLLFNPGPVNTTPTVRGASIARDMCHRAPDFVAAMRQAAAGVSALLPGDDIETVLVSGSATYSLEAAITGLASGNVLVLSNGVYGERLASICTTNGIAAHVHAAAGAFDLDAVEADLAGDRFDAVLVVHHETSTGRLNDLSGIAALSERTGVRLVVDAVSSLGAEEFAFSHRDWVVIGTANKCIEGLPGLGTVSAPADVWRHLGPGRGFALSLQRHREAQLQDTVAFTPPVNAVLALNQALGELEVETVEGRRARYLAGLDHVEARFAALGLARLVPAAEGSSSLAAFTLPPAMSYDDLERGLWEYGIVAYAAQGHLGATHFRISAMGDGAPERFAALTDAMAALVASRAAG